MNDLQLMSWEGEPDFAALSDKGRRKVRARIAAVERILKAKRGQIGTVEQNEGRGLGIGQSAMKNLVKQYRDSGGDWRSMIDWASEPHTDQQLPPAFLDFWRMLCEDNQRKSKPAHKELCRIYWRKETEYVSPKGWRMELWPGYDERPEPSALSRASLPRGWSYPNLMLHAPTKLELVLSREGPLAASALAPQVFTTRENLRPGQFYVFDDRWNDLKCIVPGRMTKPVRSIELSAGDVFSAKTVSWGLIPLIEDDNGKREQITGDYMRMILVDLLCGKGFHRDGVTLMVEHGTAAISSELELLLCVLSGGEVREGKIVRPGLIRVDRSGITGGVSFCGGYPTLGKGNFRFKAGWESMHNLKHNELANLPGQTGRNSRLEIVESLPAQEREATKLLLAATEARPDVAKILLSGTGFLDSTQLLWAFQRVLKQIEGYTDHELQGWERAGLVTTEYRLAPDAPWQPMARLQTYGDVQRAAIVAQIESEPWSTRTRKLSRQEAWASGQRELVKLPLHVAPQILGTKLSTIRPVNERGEFCFADADLGIGSDEVIFRAILTTPEGHEMRLPRGEYRTWLNYLNPSQLLVADLRGCYLGSCEMQDRIDRRDTEAFKREAGEAAHVQATALAPLYRRAVKRNADITRQRKDNAAAAEYDQHGSGNIPVTEDQKAVAAYVASRTEPDEPARDENPSTSVRAVPTTQDFYLNENHNLSSHHVASRCFRTRSPRPQRRRLTLDIRTP